MTTKVKYVNNYMMGLVNELKSEVINNDMSVYNLFANVFGWGNYNIYNDLFMDFDDSDSQLALIDYIFKDDKDAIALGTPAQKVVVMPAYPFED